MQEMMSFARLRFSCASCKLMLFRPKHLQDDALNMGHAIQLLRNVKLQMPSSHSGFRSPYKKQQHGYRKSQTPGDATTDNSIAVSSSQSPTPNAGLLHKQVPMHGVQRVEYSLGFGIFYRATK